MIITEQIILLLLPIFCINASLSEDNLLKLWKLLGWKKLIVVKDQKVNQQVNILNFTKNAMKQDFIIACVDSNENMMYSTRVLKNQQQQPIVFLGETELNCMLIHELVKNGQPPYLTMLVSLPTKNDESIFDLYFANITASMGLFYITKTINQDWNLYRVQTFKDQHLLVKNQFIVDEQKTTLTETFDLESAVLNAIDHSYMPYMNTYDCDNTKGINYAFSFVLLSNMDHARLSNGGFACRLGQNHEQRIQFYSTFISRIKWRLG